MNIRTIVNEPRRGCGYRKPGGLYLISGAPAAPCGKLPLPLEVCPTCGQGIKPARGWTWVNGRELVRGVKCIFADQKNCFLCHMERPPEKVGLIWVGEKFYKTPLGFTDEAIAQGVSRRINFIPHGFVLGETWVWLAHRKAVICRECVGAGVLADSNEPDGRRSCEECEGKGFFHGVFQAFKPEHIEYILKGDESEKELERMEKRGITLIKLVRTDDGKGNGVLDLEESAAI